MLGGVREPIISAELLAAAKTDASLQAKLKQLKDRETEAVAAEAKAHAKLAELAKHQQSLDQSIADLSAREAKISLDLSTNLALSDQLVSTAAALRDQEEILIAARAKLVADSTASQQQILVSRTALAEQADCINTSHAEKDAAFTAREALIAQREHTLEDAQRVLTARIDRISKAIA